MFSAELSHCHSEILFTRTAPEYPSSLCWIHSNVTNRDAKQQFTIYTTHPSTSSKTLRCLFLSYCFAVFPRRLKGSVNEFRTISGIEIYWQNSNEPACLPAWLRGSHCPECSEHMLLSCTACLTAKGWFNYINCLMTEERAAGPCMLVCDKRGTLQRRGPHYASLTVT